MVNQSNAKEESSRLNAIFEHVAEGIIVIDDKGVIESLNSAAKEMFGYTKEEVVGKNVSMLMPEPYRSEHDSYMERYKQTRVPHIIGIGREVVGLKKNGTIFPFHLSVSEVHLEDRTIFTGIVFDLTERKQNEQKLERYAKELEKSNQELQNFAYISSHDLQEPLRKILAFGDRIFHKDHDNLSEKGQDYLKRTLNAAERMQKLIDGLLAFSRIETRAQPFSEVDLNQVLQEVLEDLEITINQAGAQFEIDNLPTIEGERYQMRQLFQNLINNALKFRSDQREPLIRISHQFYKNDQPVKNREQANKVTIAVEDNGIGFDESYANKVFEIFSKLNGPRHEGSGIGLSICQKVIEWHNGTITAKSTVGEGTTLFIYLPVEIGKD